MNFSWYWNIYLYLTYLKSVTLSLAHVVGPGETTIATGHVFLSFAVYPWDRIKVGFINDFVIFFNLIS